MIQQLILIVHLALALAIIGLVLLQHGKGADAGAAFGSGASATIFGSQGSSNFLSKMTAYAATLLACTSIALSVMASKKDRPATLSDKLEVLSTQSEMIKEDTSGLPSIPVDDDVPTPATDD